MVFIQYEINYRTFSLNIYEMYASAQAMKDAKLNYLIKIMKGMCRWSASRLIKVRSDEFACRQFPTQKRKGNLHHKKQQV